MRPGFQSIKGLLHCISAALHFSCIAFQSITGLLHCISAALHYSQSRVSCIAKAWQVPVWHGAEPMKQSVNCHRSPKRQLQRKAETALHCSIMHTGTFEKYASSCKFVTCLLVCTAMVDHNVGKHFDPCGKSRRDGTSLEECPSMAHILEQSPC